MEALGQLFSAGASAGTSALNMIGQLVMTYLANEQNERRYQEGMGLLGGLLESQVPEVRAMAQQAQEQYSSLLPQYHQLMGDVTGQYRDLRSRSLGYLQGAGAQERSDINRAFANTQGAVEDSLISRGLGNSTVMSDAAGNIARNRADAMGGLEERLRNQYLTTDQNLTGLMASSQERMGSNWYSMLDQHIGRQMQLGMLPLDLQRDLTYPIVNSIFGRNDVAPSEANYLASQAALGQGFGGSFVRAPQAPSGGGGFFEGLLPPLFAAGTAGIIAGS